MKRMKRNYFIYIFIFWYMAKIICSTTFETIGGIPVDTVSSMINYLVLVLLVIQMVFFQSYGQKEFVIIAVVSIPFLITAAVSRSFSLLSGWMFVVAAKDTSFEKIIKTVYRALLFTIFLVFVLYSCNILEDYTMVRGGAIRHSLGFSHPNQLGVRMFQLIACHCYLHRHKMRAVDYGIAAAAAAFVYVVPNSQSSCMCIVVLALLLAIGRLLEKYKEGMLSFCGKGLTTAAALFNILSVLLSVIDVKSHDVLRQIDVWMSYRFSHSFEVLQVYGIPLWGQKVFLMEEERQKMGMMDGAGRLYLDNAYMSLFIKYGIVSYLIFSVAYLVLMNDCRKKKRYFTVSILFVYALYGIMENAVFMMSHNIFLLAFAGMMYERLSRIKDKKLCLKIQRQ